MNIDSYVADLERRIVESPLISSYTITIDRKTADIAFIYGIMDLRNGITVDFKEYIEDTGDTIQKFMYGYNVRQDADVLFRYATWPRVLKASWTARWDWPSTWVNWRAIKISATALPR